MPAPGAVDYFSSTYNRRNTVKKSVIKGSPALSGGVNYSVEQDFFPVQSENSLPVYSSIARSAPKGDEVEEVFGPNRTL